MFQQHRYGAVKCVLCIKQERALLCLIHYGYDQKYKWVYNCIRDQTMLCTLRLRNKVFVTSILVTSFLVRKYLI